MQDRERSIGQSRSIEHDMFPIIKMSIGFQIVLCVTQSLQALEIKDKKSDTW